MSRHSILTSTALAVTASLVLLTFGHSAYAVEAPVNLGTAAAYSVLGGTTVTNATGTTLSGNLGVSPGSSITGFPPGLVAGETHAADAQSLQAQADATLAYGDVAGRSGIPTPGGGVDLVGQTIVPGAYNNGGALGLTGTVTLDALGDPNAVFIFQSTSTLITGTGSSVSLVNGASSCNVYWLVPSSATLGTGSTFAGTILASTSIDISDSVTVQGRAFASTGAVTLINDTFTSVPCATPSPSPSASVTESPSVTASEEAAAPTLANTGLELWVVWLIGLAIFAGIVTYLYGHLKRRRNASNL